MKIILIGFMGSGKSTIARQLGKKLNLEVIEMDELVLKLSAKNSINDIFIQNGESVFRELEIAVSRQLRSERNVIIATGGGVVMNKLNLDYLRENEGIIIYLQTSFAAIIDRLSNDNTRPLMSDKQKAKHLYDFRKQLYKYYADIQIDTNDKAISEIINNIINQLKYLQNDK